MSPSINDHLEAVKDHLTTAGIACGRGKPPDGYGPDDSWVGAPGQSAFNEYAFVSKVGSIETRNSSITGTIDEANPLVNIQCVGKDDAQVETLLDSVKDAMDAQTITVPGRSLLRTWLDVTTSTFTDYDVTPPVRVASVRYRLWTTV